MSIRCTFSIFSITFSSIDENEYFPLSPVDTGLKLNVHKTFRRRPGCFLNVLCTFSLRHVSTGSHVRSCARKF